MIQSVEIKGLRGVREGKLTDLTSLAVLVGPNGSGKSTVLEALLIGASPDPAAGLAEVVRRHVTGGAGLRWILWKVGEAGPAEITLTANGDLSRLCRLEIERGKPKDQTQINLTIEEKNSKRVGGVLGLKNQYLSYQGTGFIPIGDVADARLIEAYPTSSQSPLHDLFTRAIQQGRRNEAIGIIKEVFPDVNQAEILTEHGEPILHFVFATHSVPATLAGDGIHSLLRLSLELAASAGGIALLEEPEVHQHPGAIRQSARAILAAVRRDIQVVLTTHSVEFIDAILAQCSDEDLARLCLYRTRLQDGVLTSSRLPGPEIAFARTTIEDDLR